MLPILLHSLPALLTAGIGLMSRKENTDIQRQRMEQDERLNGLRMQFQAALERERQISQSIEAEKTRLAQTDNIRTQQAFQAHEGRLNRETQRENQRNQQAFQAGESEQNREAQRENQRNQQAFQARESERSRDAQRESQRNQQSFQANESERSREAQRESQRHQQAFQAGESELAREAQRSNLLVQLQAQRELQLEIKLLDAQLSRELKRFDRETSLNQIREQRRQQNSPLVAIAEDLLQADLGGGNLHIFFAPPTVRNDKINTEQSFKLASEVQLYDFLGKMIAQLRGDDARIHFHGGGWQTRAIHSETAVRQIFRELRSEAVIILETFADGSTYYINVSFWAENWPDFRYVRLFSFDWKEVYIAAVKANTLRRQTLNLTDEDLASIYEKNVVDAFRANQELMAKEEKARKLGLPERDIRMIASKYQGTPQDTEAVVDYLHHAIAVGLLVDEYYLLHAPTAQPRQPVLPKLLNSLLEDQDWAADDRQRLTTQLAAHYDGLYQQLAQMHPAWAADRYLELAQVCMQLGATEAAHQAAARAAQHLLTGRGVWTPHAPETALALLADAAMVPALTPADLPWLAAMQQLLQQLPGGETTRLPGPAELQAWQQHLADLERKAAEAIRLAEAEQARKRREAEAKAEAERKAAEAIRLAEAEQARKRREAEAKAEAERKAAEALRLAEAEQARKRREAEAKAEAEHKAAEAIRLAEAEQARKRREAEAKAEAERKAAEAIRLAEAEQARKRREAEAKAEAEHKAAEAIRLAEAEQARKRREAEAERKAKESQRKLENNTAGGFLGFLKME